MKNNYSVESLVAVYRNLWRQDPNLMRTVVQKCMLSQTATEDLSDKEIGASYNSRLKNYIASEKLPRQAKGELSEDYWLRLLLFKCKSSQDRQKQLAELLSMMATVAKGSLEDQSLQQDTLNKLTLYELGKRFRSMMMVPSVLGVGGLITSAIVGFMLLPFSPLALILGVAATAVIVGIATGIQYLRMQSLIKKEQDQLAKELPPEPDIAFNTAPSEDVQTNATEVSKKSALGAFLGFLYGLFPGSIINGFVGAASAVRSFYKNVGYLPEFSNPGASSGPAFTMGQIGGQYVGVIAWVLWFVLARHVATFLAYVGAAVVGFVTGTVASPFIGAAQGYKCGVSAVVPRTTESTFHMFDMDDKSDKYENPDNQDPAFADDLSVGDSKAQPQQETPASLEPAQIPFPVTSALHGRSTPTTPTATVEDNAFQPKR